MSHPSEISQSDLVSAVEELRRRYVRRNPHSAKAYNRACSSLSGGGTRTSLYVDPFPLFVEGGSGATLKDVDGHEYIDFLSDFTSGIFGHSEPGIRNAITDALQRGIQLGAHTEHEARFGELLCSRFSAMDLIRFANSGTEANLLAISTALRHTGRNKVLVFEGGYHGSLLSHFTSSRKKDVVQAKGASGEREYESKVLSVPYDFLVAPYNDLAEAEALVSANKGDIAAIVVEPMIGAGGCIPGNPSFLRGLRDLATSTGAVLIWDEVQTARLGVSGRQGILGIEPDMTTLGKFFGGGFAFGAFGGKKEIMSMFDSRQHGAVSHGGTFNNSILTVVAGSYATEHLLTGPALAKLNSLGDHLRTSLNDLFTSTSLPYEITGLGSINQFHCRLKGEDKTAGMDMLFFYLLEKGFWIAQRGLVALSFAITDADVEHFLQAVKSFAEVYRSRLASRKEESVSTKA